MSAVSSHAEALRLRRRAPLLSGPADPDRAARRALINGIHIDDEIAQEAKRIFDRIIKRGLSECEGLCAILAANSGAGKTHLLNRLRKRPELQPDHDEFGPRTPLVCIKAPAPCNLKTLGKEIYRSLTGDDLQKMTTDEIWRRVGHQLYGQSASILAIDEFHHVFGANDHKSRQVVINTLKNLLLPDPSLAPLPGGFSYPLQLVLSGMPVLDAVANEDLQLSRRAIRLRIEPVKATEAGLTKVEEIILALEPHLGFSNAPSLATRDMVLRFYRASEGYIGRVIHLVKEAAYLAIDDGSACIDQYKHLAVIAGSLCAVPQSQNPFIVADVERLAKAPHAASIDGTRLRGAGSRGGSSSKAG